MQSILSSRIKKLLVSINQLNSSNFTYFYYKLIERAKEAIIYTTRLRIPRSQMLIFLVFLETQIYSKEDKPSQKVVIVEEKLDDIDIDGIRNSEDLPRIIFIIF